MDLAGPRSQPNHTGQIPSVAVSIDTDGVGWYSCWPGAPASPALVTLSTSLQEQEDLSLAELAFYLGSTQDSSSRMVSMKQW